MRAAVPDVDAALARGDTSGATGWLRETVQRHGGLLAVESEAGAWTAFTFDLPRPE